MTIVLRSVKGTTLTHAELDGNFTDLDDRVDALEAVPASHTHDLADITDAGDLAALDTITTDELDSSVYASEAEAEAGVDEIKIMSALRVAQAIAELANAGSVLASEEEAEEGTENTKFMSALRVAQAISAQVGGLLSEVTRLNLGEGTQDYTVLAADAGTNIVFYGATGVPTVFTDPELTEGLWFLSCEHDVDQDWTLSVDAASTVDVGNGTSPISDDTLTLNKSSMYLLLLVTGDGVNAEYLLKRITGNSELGTLAEKNSVTNVELSTTAISGFDADASPDGAADYALVLDATGPTFKKVLLNNFPTAGGGTARTFSGTMTPDTGTVIYANFSQSGAQSFTKGSGTSTGSVHVLPFNGDGAALTWNAGFVAADGLIAGNLPAALTGWYTIAATYHAARDEFLVTWTKAGAADIPYDNSDADLTADNVKDALDELSDAYEDLSDAVDLKLPTTGVGLVEQITGHIETAANKDYFLDQSAAYAYTINTLITDCLSGTCTAALEIDGTPVTGISSVAVSSTEATGTASAANVVSVGNTVELVLSSNSSALDVRFTMKVTRS